MQVISATQARRRFRRIMKLLQQGHSFVITRNGKPVSAGLCRLKPRDACAVGGLNEIRKEIRRNWEGSAL
ncbi:Antitoxin component of toxin-antitoxin stability system, DNA-binding transcriptional repressor [Pseudomonas mohnii]|uniref:Antitoxin n=1 Tax=Pseudomonas mohnii TaxID=395600 RepID=A0ABY0XXH5_9PSED|nr:type II toxin-antitoxin system Phd/YefM family antitoxin [Pseudomonas mohnii]SEC47189.1 Antitoxin component of toxin-antitoxin stability system, DNA-binding transcriptional repressor [Pseudomonas mohnii]